MDTILLKSFEFEGKSEPVIFVQTLEVTEGVECDVYDFLNDENKDLGIIRIAPGHKTPLQKILQGERTIEGYVSGKGKLIVTRKDGTRQIHDVGDKPLVALVEIGDTMQWQAADDLGLVASEVCYPPYEEGRFENVTE